MIVDRGPSVEMSSYAQLMLVMSHSVLPGAKIAVSSVLNRDVKQFGKQHLTDDDDETCWNSHQGTPQYIGARLSAPHRPRQLRLQFQGGFVGADCWLEAGPAPDQLHRLHAFYPDNINRLQTFDVDCPHPVTHVKVVFNGSTDFFGRVVVYRFDLLADAEDSVDGQPVG
ncbi:nuclear receptor 2C2-associated protein-like isoform X2 [Pollicipes pollicipes]|uniref:nuclear receptor 2C2-associated protein-like isoform X2 n=1 Tax=Pollicipes pollicipes TaxID=41117 RepID=UPI001884D9BF|nr:nuclear receptor 2C2-associated protein-like isoform X2 [Pollicipes pollicipes]